MNQGLIVKIPEHEIVYEDWTGTGYIKENIETGESGWMLSGMIAGSMTVWGVERWDDSIIAMLINAYSEPANQDSESGRYIRKIPSTDFQPGTVGKKLPKALQVKVKDKNGTAVENAKVIFTVKAGGGTLKKVEDTSPGDGLTRIEVYTKGNGVASVNLILGKYTSDNPTMWMKKEYTYAMQVGENIVDARLESGLKIIEPFTAFGFPTEDKTEWKIRMIHGEGEEGNILSWVGYVSVVVEDNYQNPVSNVPVTFTSGNVQKRDGAVCDYSGQSFENAKLVNRNDSCMDGIPTYDQCGTDKIEDVVTSRRGALVQVILGSRPEGKYPIKVTSGELNAITINLYTWQFMGCYDSEYSLKIVSSYASDGYGNSIDAGKVGTEIPIKAKCYFLIAEYHDGKRKYYIDYGKNVSVKFAGKLGTNLNTEPGVYRGMYTLHGDPKVNQIRIDCTATVDKGPDTGKIVSDWSSKYVYGVDIVTKPEYIVPVDENGYVTWDTKMRYEIKPSGGAWPNWPYAASTAYVVILKEDVKGDVPVAYIPSDKTGTGFGALSRGFKFDRNISYKAQVILNIGTGVEIKGKEVPISFVELKMEVEKKDTVNFPDVELRWDDYYPALGTKTITLIGEKNPGSIDVMKVKCEVDPPIKDVTIIEPVKTFNDGKARFKLSAPPSTVPKTGEGDTVGIDEIQLKFTLIDEENVEVIELFEVWNVKNNSNTNLKEVLDGEAVFIYDTSDDEHNIGHTENRSVDDNAKKEFDVVQELFNQVVPRNRKVGDGNYDLMDENGIFDLKVKNALELFKDHFKVDNTTGGSDFKKLEKDYSSVDSSWANQIIGKKILMGNKAGDNQINGSTEDDTGLYELYENVVKVFVKKMIEDADSYASFSTDYRARSNASSGAITQLEDDDGQVNVNISDLLVSTGVSYSYGDIDTPGQFADVINQQNITNWKDYTNGHKPGKHNYEHAYWSQGQQDPANFNVEKWPKTKNWPPGGTIVITYGINLLGPAQWGGIDCNGFVQRVINSADAMAQKENLGVNSHVQPLNSINDKKPRSYFNDPDRSHCFGSDDKKFIHKGDIVQYSEHISIVYSDRWGESMYLNTLGTMYDVIHAYGISSYDDDGDESTAPIFSRKVLITGENIGGTPSGFGRIKLWN